MVLEMTLYADISLPDNFGICALKICIALWEKSSGVQKRQKQSENDINQFFT